jgi:7-cyano-7-deazaguanine reductase
MPPVEPSHLDLEVVKNHYSDRNYTVKISIPEFSCVCPRTGLPDYAVIEINYIPDKHIVELKSLKLYILGFRNMGIFHENATNKIMDDFKMASQPRKIEVWGRFNPRGGISTVVESRWPE